MKKDKISQSKLKIKTGDIVKVVAGDSKGMQGKILRVLLSKNRAVVEGANLVTKHLKPSATNPDGGIIKMEAPIHISNLAVIDPKTGLPTRVGRRQNNAGKMVRYAKKSGEDIN